MYSPIHIRQVIIFTLLLTIASACTKDPDPVNESELITSFYMSLIPTDHSDTLILSFYDPDGDGGLPPAYVADHLKANVSYICELNILNQSITPSINVTEEIRNEATDHQFFYTLTDSSSLQFNYLDFDSNGFPLGSKIDLLIKKPGQTTLKIFLRHLPDKQAPGVKQGDPKNAGGETDLEINFDLIVE